MTAEVKCNALQLSEQWYVSLIDDCKDIIVEAEFQSRWSLVEGYHQVGIRILQENSNFERSRIYGENIVQRIAESLQRKPRTIYYAVQFAKTYPDLDLLPEGKNTSWHRIVDKYLTDGKDKVKKPSLTAIIQEIKKLLEIEIQKARQLQVSFAQEPTEEKVYADRITFIRYLQDQFDKIVGAME